VGWEEGKEGKGEGRREEPPGADDDTHVTCRDVLGDGQGHGPSIAHGGVLVRYEGPAKRTAPVPHGGVSLGFRVRRSEPVHNVGVQSTPAGGGREGAGVSGLVNASGGVQRHPCPMERRPWKWAWARPSPAFVGGKE